MIRIKDLRDTPVDIELMRLSSGRVEREIAEFEYKDATTQRQTVVR
jgi:hypothetical protein